MAAARVLVADDEVQYVDVVAFKLRNAGLEVLIARDGQEALQRAIAERPDLVVSDYQMPVLDGMGFCRQLRATPGIAATPFILLTAHGLDIQDDATSRAGVSLVMSKPFSPRELLLKVNELLARSRPLAAVTE